MTYAQIEEAHSQVEGFRDRLQRAVVRREAGVLPSAAVASPTPPPPSPPPLLIAPSESAHSQEGEVLIGLEHALSEGASASSPHPPPPASESDTIESGSSQDDDTCSESGGVIINPEDGLSEGE